MSEGIISKPGVSGVGRIEGVTQCIRDKIIVKGTVIRITETHYITSFNGGISSWSKKYYKLPYFTKIAIKT